ncbi:MAG: DCC1-like thiol-disulfide oxidoreductase family protein [Gammaproteobacteria bacterium]|nr:DCC1-like thiol-disulfide oxidoreductase family protein [Gammaproteobacteria bacterium]
MDIANRVIVYDGICGLCHGWVRFVIRFDPGAVFRFTSIQSESGQSILAKYNLPTDRIETLVYVEDGKLYLRSQACLMIIRQLSFPVRLLYGFVIVPQFIRDGMYKQIAHHRYTLFGLKDECLLTDSDLRNRFI